MKPIKVLHIISVEKENFYLNNLTDLTDSNEIDYSFVTFFPECDFGRELEKRGKRVFYLDCLERKSYPKAYRKLKEIFKEINPDVVHTHLFDQTFIGFTAAKKRKKVFTRHHSDALYKLPTAAKRAFYLKLEGYNNSRADHIIAPSQMVRDILVEKENVPSEKVSRIPYGQTNERYDKITPEIVAKTRAELGMNDQLSIVCVSRLFNRKGHIYLFEAIAPLLKNGLSAKLYLIGTGGYKENLEKMTRDLGISDHVEFVGWRDDILEVIASADIIAHPSIEDALSQSLIESLMMARPIVATDISGASDTLNGGKYGKLVPPEDSESFRIALQEIIENLDQARENAKEGRKYLLEYMNAQRVADEYVKIYRKVVGLK